MKNYYEYWYKRFIKDGLKACKMIIGLGLAAGLGYSVSLPIGILFFMWVLVESLIDRNQYMNYLKINTGSRYADLTLMECIQHWGKQWGRRMFNIINRKMTNEEIHKIS